MLDAYAHEGVCIKKKLLNWKQRNLEVSKDPERILASTVHSALILYHCRNFSFYSCWTTREIPQLDQEEIDENTSAILTQSQSLLDTCIPSVLLLFPLRMAGAHVFLACLQVKVLNILGQIRKKGFIVSDRIETDLREFWHYISTLDSGNED